MARRLASLAIGTAVLCLVSCGDDGNGGGPPECVADGQVVPDIAGDWLVHDLVLSSSDCDAEVDDILQEAIASSNQCVFRVAQEDARVSATDCAENVWSGCVNEAGEIAISLRRSESDLGCTVRVDAAIAANLTGSPTAGTLTLNVDFSGTCVFEDDCIAVVDGTVTEELPVEAPADGAANAVADALLARLVSER